MPNLLVLTLPIWLRRRMRSSSVAKAWSLSDHACAIRYAFVGTAGSSLRLLALARRQRSAHYDSRGAASHPVDPDRLQHVRNPSRRPDGPAIRALCMHGGARLV